MAKNKRRKPKKSNPKPIGIKYTYEDGDFKLYKIWSKKFTAKDPFYITSELDELVDELAEKKEIWGVTIDLKNLLKFTEQYKQ